ncbi:MAG: YncE family protein [Actinomycetota bacterium]|nr:YncE family protein [Actinomycetota bacterium]
MLARLGQFIFADHLGSVRSEEGARVRTWEMGELSHDNVVPTHVKRPADGLFCQAAIFAANGATQDVNAREVAVDHSANGEARREGEVLTSAPMPRSTLRRATAMAAVAAVVALVGSASSAVAIGGSPTSADPKLVATIPVGIDLGVPVLDVAAHRLYVPVASQNSIAVIDTARDAVAATIGRFNGPLGLVLDSARHRLYVSNSKWHSVAVLDTTTNRQIASVDVGALPGASVLDTGRQLLYVLNTGEGSVSVVDTRRNAVVSTIALGGTPIDAVLDPTGRRLYVSTHTGFGGGNGKVSVVNTKTSKLIASLSLADYPRFLILNAAAHRLYAAVASRSAIQVIDTTRNKVITTIKVGRYPYDAALDEGRQFLYVTNTDSWNEFPGSVSVIDARANRVVSTISFDQAPTVLALDAGAQRLYVAIVNPDRHGTRFSVIDTATNAVIVTSPSITGASPPVLVVDPSLQRLYAPHDFNITAGESVTPGVVDVFDIQATARLVRSSIG